MRPQQLLDSKDIVYADQDLMVINKPSGIATHPGPGCPESVTCLSEVRRLASSWVYPVHRLDRPTSGLLIFARSQEVARLIRAAFENDAVAKTYLAIVRGHTPQVGTIDKPLAHPTKGTLQSAETHFTTITYGTGSWPVRPYPTSRYSLVKLCPKTGRTHQLRRHMASMSHPIIGDTCYGDGAHNKAWENEMGMRRLWLHAAQISFPHPRSGCLLNLSAPLDHEWSSALKKLFSHLVLTDDYQRLGEQNHF